MRSRRLPTGLIVPAALVVLVGLLATLQYKWLGQVSDAERNRLRASLQQSAEDFARDFDRELTQTYTTFQQADGAALVEHNWSAFATRYDTWRDTAKDPQLVEAIYLSTEEGATKAFLKYAPERRVFEPAAWPGTLGPIRDALNADHPSIPLAAGLASGVAGAGGSMTASAAGRLAFMTHESVFPSVPALVVSLGVPSVQTFSVANTKDIFTMPIRLPSASLVIAIDRERIRSSILPALVTRYFSRDADQYRFAVIDGSDAPRTVYARGLGTGSTLDPAHADLSVPIFSLRSDLTSQMVIRPTLTTAPPSPLPPPSAPRTVSDNAAGAAQGSAATFRSSQMLSIVVGGRAGQNDINFAARPVIRPSWHLVLQHTSGSLDAAVREARLRNLWLSFGILAVLAAGVGLIVVNAERSSKLASQQMDFVATVSHELRTPLTVIRSAAQNLSAGVVSDPSQAKRYGDLIEAEGRRLTDMVEQVLEYAGLSGQRRLALAQPLDAGALTRDVVDSCASLFEADRVAVQLSIGDDLPPVVADEGAVRRALNNLLTNALKYGADGRWIGVSVRVAATHGRRGEVQISVSDKGRGIDAGDLPHIFEAFYRGRYAVDRQIHGNGLGLSLVKRIAEAHGGRVTVTSAPGSGATFTIHLPATTPEPAAVHPLIDPAPDAGHRGSMA